MVAFSRPSAGQQLRNYTILDLDGEPLVVLKRWVTSVLDYRAWCYNSTNERFQFGNRKRRSAMIPPSGEFFFYLKLAGEWLCLVIQGPTSYLIAFIISSIGRDDELHIKEMDRPNGIKYIKESKNLFWNGRYKNAEHAQVGYEALIEAFLGMYRFVSGISRPPLSQIFRWCDVFVIHFPEAGRFDSLLLCNIYSRFVDGGKVGKSPIDKARNWSKDCICTVKRITEKVVPARKNKKWEVKRSGNSKKPKVPGERSQKKCGHKRSDIIEDTKLPSASEDEDSNDEWNEVSDERLLKTLNDIRLFHRKKPVLAEIKLSSMPIQLYNGKAVNPPSEELERSDVDFLIAPFGNLSHNHCTYINGEWVCKATGSEKYSVSKTNQVNYARMKIDNANQLQIRETKMETMTTFQHDEEKKDVAKDEIVKHNCGLRNLGNTCYINSTLACRLFQIHSKYREVNHTGHELTLATRDLFLQLGESVGPLEPRHIVELLRKRNSAFSEQHDNVYRHQDAEECWSHLITTFEQAFKSELIGSDAVSMRDLFGIKLMRRTCDGDSGKEFPVDFMYFLKCYISEGVNHLTHGLEVCSKSYEKFSPNRGVPCNESTIIEISRYLTVQFLRLNWNIDSKESGKILQRVEYPATFDIKDYCSDGLKEKLEATREVFWGSSSEGIDKVSSSTETQQLTGIYDLICVLTHEGTSTDSGHYVAWIKQEGQWIMCDGDQVYVCEEQEVVGLSGGNEGHAAYICLYKGQTLRVQAEDEAMTDH